MSEYSDKITQYSVSSVDSCPKFSIIIPAYNTEKYIAKCLDSLINQEIPERNYEILITDDGSSDKTGTICDTYAAEYPFIHVTHTSNHGVSHARNIALEKCSGEYVMFCDSDDFVSPQIISVLTRAAEVFGKPDMMVYGLFIGELHGGKWPIYNVEAMSEADGELSSAKGTCMKIFADPMTGGYMWNKATKREFLLSKNFDETLSMHEDEYYLLSILLQNIKMRICHLRYCLYQYVQHRDFGLTRDFTKTHTEIGYPKHIETSERMLAELNIPDSLRDNIESRIYSWAVGHIFSDPKPMNPEVYSRLWETVHKYAGKYYFKYHTSLFKKAKTFIKHILILLHIYKPCWK